MRGKLAILARLRLARRRAAPHPPAGEGLLIFTGSSCGLAGGFLLGLRPGRLGGGLPGCGLRRRGGGLLVQQAFGHRVELPELVLTKDILPDLGLGAVLHAHSHQVNDLIGQDVAQLDLAAAASTICQR